jgi:hypothetical protein
MSTCRVFRNFKSSRSSYNPTIIEAVRASWATPGLFPSILLGANLMREELVSAVNGFNNPTLETIKEAKDIFGKERRVSCLLSLGTGQADIRSTASKDFMTKTAQDTETIARESQRRFGSLGIYFRFSVERGMDSEGVIGEEALGAIAAHTSVYLEGDDSAKRLDRFVTISGSTNRTTLDTLCELYVPLWCPAYASYHCSSRTTPEDKSVSHTATIVRISRSQRGSHAGNSFSPEW